MIKRVNLLQIKTTVGNLQKFVDGKWKSLPDSERFRVTKNEGQVYFLLIQNDAGGI